VHTKFAALSNDSSLNDQPKAITDIFAAMEQVTVTELKALREKDEANPVEPDDTFIDFATEDFINKNIRVRPISGITGDGKGDGRQSEISKGHGDEGEDPQDNYNIQALYELDMQRDQIKRKIAAYQEEQRRKQALEDKKNSKK